MTLRPEPLVLEGLGMTYSGKLALEGVSTTVEPGKTLAVLGPSGCGKSTLLKIVAGLAAPTRGSVKLGEKLLSSPQETVSPERRGVSMVFQDYALWPHLRVAEIIGYGLRYGVNRIPVAQRRRRVSELMQMMQLEGLERRRPAELSGGQQQRVSIARALATEPDLLLFDEPLSNLDAQLRTHMRQELSVLLKRLGTTALYVTHDVQEALELADNILVLEGGRAVQKASPAQLVESPANSWVESLVRHRTQQIRAIADADGRLVLQTPHRYQPGEQALLTIEPENIVTDDVSAA